MKDKKPLVSIMIPNRNHSMFLSDCIESALNQTYDNIEIIILDNCSDDNSVEVAAKYINRGVRLCKNPENIMNNSYNILSLMAEGKYITLLCADDIIRPAFIEKSVSIMEKHQDVGYVHCERDYIDENNNITELDPFYNCSFIAPGESAAPIYLLTDVAQPAQCLMRRDTFLSVLGYETEFNHCNADRELWFRLSLVSNYAYLQEKLACIRIHNARETILAFKNLFHTLSLYAGIYSQGEYSRLYGFENVYKRLPDAYNKLATESLKIAMHFVKENKPDLAKKYILFAEIADEHICAHEQYHKTADALKDCNKNTKAFSDNERHVFTGHTRRYAPPEGFQKI
jgi:glycosyltransferase involved in cell wall biosynthesis